MSQKTQILGVKHSGGSVYLGEDSSGNPQWTRDANRIMEWLCDGWRYRFNQHRAHRTERKILVDKETGNEVWVDTPLGGIDVPRLVSDKEARLAHSWLRAVPADILKSPKQIENVEWFSSIRRKSKSGGRLPRFRSSHTAPKVFTCWRNGTPTGNAIFTKTSKRSGIVTISGLTPGPVSQLGEKGRWKL